MNYFRICFGLLLAASVATAQQYVISTIAGVAGSRGYYGDGGAPTGAELDMPTRVAVDPKGNYYFTDYLTYVVRKVTAAGVISTIAGNGANAFAGDGAAGTSASISDVHGLAADGSGNLYIADTGNARVRKVDSSGNITTLAGTGAIGYAGDGSAAKSAVLARPSGVAVDAAGNVYIADYGNSTVRKVASSGAISLVAGTGAYGYGGDGGPANKAALATPFAIALDPAGNIYVSDTANTNIRKITADGNIQTVATGVDAESLAVDAAGNIYYPDYLTQTVQKILPNGAQLAIAGNGTPGYSGDGGPGTNGQLNLPYGVALDLSGNIYVADSSNQVIRLLTPVVSSIGIVSAASSLGAAIAPGEIVVLYGTGIGPQTLAVNNPVNGFFGTQLAGTNVTFDGINAPILYTSANQVAAIVPYAESPGLTAQIAITYQGQTVTGSAPVAPSAPAVFTSSSTGGGQAAAVNQDGTLNGAANPARIGSIISLYVTGVGQTDPAGTDGQIAPGASQNIILPVQVTVAGQPAAVAYAGAAPGSVTGLSQVNIQIPPLNLALSSGPADVPVVLIVAGIRSQTAVTIAVSGQ